MADLSSNWSFCSNDLMNVRNAGDWSNYIGLNMKTKSKYVYA